MGKSLLATLTCCIVMCGSSTFAAQPKSNQFTQEQVEFFEQRVRPVLVTKCVKCHGPKKQENGLRLDSRDAVLKGSENGPVVKAGDPAGSALIRAIGYDGDVQMPPKKKLSAKSISAIRQWVQMGLPWPAASDETRANARDAHWAFQPIDKAEVPQDAGDHWSRTPIDRFVAARLKKNGLQPSPPADRRTLIRRATFDLLGLPPTPEEINAFERESIRNPKSAFRNLIDRLLKSPHYGERWGRHWLDVARYADSGNRWAYTYRDYVVRAFNEDLPFDRFVLEQLAADQLDLGEDKRALAAMGFLTAGNRFFAEFDALHDIMDDRIDVVTRGLLGLTVSCARCHEHKYDPITQADYYGLYGVFRSSVEPLTPPLLSRPQLTDEYKDFAVELQKRKKKLVDFVDRTHAELVTKARLRTAEHLLAAHAQRNHPETGAFLLLQATKDELQPVVLRRWRGYLRRTRVENDPVWRLWHALAELSEDKFTAKAPAVIAQLVREGEAPAEPSSSGDSARRTTRGAVPPRPPLNPLLLNAFAKPPRSMQEVAEGYGELLNRIDRRWQEVRKQAAESSQPAPTRLADDAEEQLRQVFHGPDAPPNLPKTVGPRFTFVLRYEPTQVEFNKLLNSVREWINSGRGAPPRATVLVDAKTPYKPRIFIRGNPSRLGKSVPRRFLSVLDGQSKPFAQGSGRLELARAIVDPANPLTARVIVNRIWMHHFGQGLVRTPSDFGKRSQPPSHPDLLDHLASTFVQAGWSIKKLHRRIMLSAAYQQKSNDRDQCLKVDPENRLLWKMNRRRLDFEGTRDSLLAVSNGLDRTVGGPPSEQLVLQLVRPKGEPEQVEEEEELNERDLRERIEELKDELERAREADNEAEVREITELLKKLQARLEEGGNKAKRRRRIDELKGELEKAREAGNEAEVREIQELIKRLEAIGRRKINAAAAIAAACSDPGVQEMIGDVKRLRAMAEFDRQKRVWIVVFFTGEHRIGLALVSQQGEFMDRASIEGLDRELKELREDGKEDAAREIAELLKKAERISKEGSNEPNRRRRLEQLGRELDAARNAGNDAEVREIEELLRDLDADTKPESDERSQERETSENDKSRRTIYGVIERGRLPELFRTFDFPSPATTNAIRDTTTVPPQALFLMNNRFVRQCARRLAERADVAALQTFQAKLSRIHQLVFGRKPTTDELQTARRFLGEEPSPDAWTDFIHAMLMTNEFVFVD